MALDADHQVGETGHVTDHNLIDLALNARAPSLAGTTTGQVAVWDATDARYEPATVVDVTAADVPFTPTGTISATTVQAAIAEVASESGSGGATTASNTSFTPTGNIAATNVQAALVELDTEKSGTGHTHAAQGVSVQDENGTAMTAVTLLDFQGAGVTAAAGAAGEVIVTIPGGGTGGTITTQDEGTQLSAAVTTLNFTGAGVTASGTGATTTVNIPGGSGSTVVTAGSIYNGGTAQSVAANTSVAMTFGSTSHNVGSVVAGDQQSLVVPAGKAGLWRLTVASRWATGTAGQRIVGLTVNGTNIAEHRLTASTSVEHTTTIGKARVLAVGDAIAATVFSAAATTLATGESSTWLTAEFLGPVA